MSFKTLAVSSLIALSTLNSMAHAQSRLGFLDRMMFTINPEISYQGPVFRDEDRSQMTGYFSEMTKIVLEEAHKTAKGYLDSGDTEAYYAFMVLAMTVPLHEGLLIHFRQVSNDGSICNDNANSGEIIPSSASTTRKHFQQYLKDGDRPFIVDCQKVRNDESLKQIIRGGDGSDMGVMQVSIRWHFDDFLANKKYESVRSTVNYGVNYLMRGFRSVYRNSKKYRCISKMFSSKVDYEALVRGIWAGQYNSGNVGATCRFADRSSPYRGHDVGFEKNLEKVLNFSSSKSIPVFSGIEARLDASTEAALTEVIENFKNSSNNRTSLNRLLNQ